MAQGLTPKQEAFVLAYIETGNASEAYRTAYDASGMNAASVNKEAFALLDHPKIAPRIAELRAAAADKAVLSRAWVLERLMRNAQIAMGEIKIKEIIKPKKADELPVEVEYFARDGAVANKALELLGRTDEARVFVDRHEVTGKDGGPIEVKEDLSDIERARRIAYILGKAASKTEDPPDAAG